ncbi:MAG: cytochrome c maturation protein CcmE [Kangiella sp.]|nr:MAG: cytochrome c maturation protein CcmE [Kangiella sp.]PHS19951.1 MAG: cytochrome c maturation protein CcmE [Kangiella sp.]
MKPHRKKRLLIILGSVFGVAAIVGLVLYASEQQMNLFYTPTEMASGIAPTDRVLRIGGLVKEGSVKRSESTLLTTFIVTDLAEDVTVTYDKIMPDLFREGQGVVAMGKLNDQGVFVASSVLAKHDEEYKAPEVLDALERAGHPVDKESK